MDQTTDYRDQGLSYIQWIRQSNYQMKELLGFLSQELQKKREERKNEVKKIAEDEVKFLQASGKVTKTPSFGSKKKKPASGPASVTGSHHSPEETSAQSAHQSAREDKDSQSHKTVQVGSMNILL